MSEILRQITTDLYEDVGISDDRLSLRKSFSNSHLLETPKYRKSHHATFTRPIESYRNDRNKQIRDHFNGFGEQQFLKKIKLNSTKQIDRKSIKTIQKYIKDLTTPNTLKITGGCIQQRGGSLTRLDDDQIAEDVNYDQNQELSEQTEAQSPALKFQFRQSQVKRQRAEQFYQHQRDHLSFRKGFFGHSEQSQSQEVFQEYKSKNQRPTFDTLKHTNGVVSGNSSFLESTVTDYRKEIKRLQKLTEEQSEIIQLQETMIEKLNQKLEQSLQGSCYLSAKGLKQSQAFQNLELSLQQSEAIQANQEKWEKQFEQLKTLLSSVLLSAENNECQQQYSNLQKLGSSTDSKLFELTPYKRNGLQKDEVENSNKGRFVKNNKHDPENSQGNSVNEISVKRQRVQSCESVLCANLSSSSELQLNPK